ncbi:helix-turn-helix domain-containing protein [Actinoplanes couchii]|uniref:AraC family transcriptional regulator n=1 Tax=Actinoplanes couchii TaxID=403638 RepID=A0ABQ3X8J6_9ACTN|nr:AraC family transcriptional regulator [Actinoplanes couchii]MDR6320151.1 AraC-like DNA-binding protein/quercetin dioxygenase-like cupin family protein [Actinoplanes couchii]GID54835.1 AraC family transcriptional regulator [Actinoplanes couchii]
MTARADDLGLGAWLRDPGTVVRRDVGLPLGDPVPEAIVAASETPGAPTEWEPHAHPVDELVWVRGGTMTSRIGNRLFTVPAGFGLWLPAGTVHGGRVTAGAELHYAFFALGRVPAGFGGPALVVITPLLEALLVRLTRADLDPAARERTEAVVFDVLVPAERQFALELPGDPRIDAIAEALLADPADKRGLEEWAEHLGASDRTISRAFRTATGLSFAQWRQALRVHRALAMLAEGADVRDVAERLGYAQPSTFIAAFRRVLKVTPGALAKRG